MLLNRRTKTVNIHLSPREWVLAVGMARLAHKSVAQLAADLLVAELVDFDTRKPGVLVREAKLVLTDRGRSGIMPTEPTKGDSDGTT